MLQPGYSAGPMSAFGVDPTTQLNNVFYNELSFTGQVDPATQVAQGSMPGGLPYAIPTANFAEMPDAFAVIVELPGVELKDVTLQLQGHQLVLTAFRKPIFAYGPSNYGYLATEGRFGSLSRAFVLPATVNRTAIRAQFGHGVLTIFLPKVAQQQGVAPAPSVSEVVINAAL